jgi:flagellar basal body rod protein FlgG
MDSALLTIAAGLRSHLETLDVLGNNLANASTTGYKADHEFYRLFESQAAWFTSDSTPQEMPYVEGARIDFGQGPLAQTDAVLDVALEGPGFLAVEAPGGRLYTRGGSLQLAPDGTLQIPDGLAVLDPQGRAVRIPPAGEIQIDTGGEILADGVPSGQLGVFEFVGRPPLAKAGRNYLVGPSLPEPSPAATTLVRQGYLEGSNVRVPEAAVRLVLATRNFAMMRRVASLVSDEMNGRAVQELGRTS